MMISPGSSGMRPAAPDEPVNELSARERGTLLARLLYRSGKRIAEAVHRAHETGLVGVISDGLADFGQEARHRSVGNERSGPKMFVDRFLGDGLGPVRQQQFQELERLRLQVNFAAANDELTCFRIEQAITEPYPHHHPGNKPVNPRAFGNDSDWLRARS